MDGFTAAFLFNGQHQAATTEPKIYNLGGNNELYFYSSNLY